MEKIKVTNVDTGESVVYDYSRDNWLKAPACMENGLVVMWAPARLKEFKSVRTSGKIWEIINETSNR